jgi:hypothetical protein
LVLLDQWNQLHLSDQLVQLNLVDLSVLYHLSLLSGLSLRLDQ